MSPSSSSPTKHDFISSAEPLLVDTIETTSHQKRRRETEEKMEMKRRKEDEEEGEMVWFVKREEAAVEGECVSVCARIHTCICMCR